MTINKNLRAASRQLGKHTAFLVAIAMAAVVGGASTALVMAAIPSSDGTIHACYNKTGGMLNLIDSEAGKTCTNKQNAISWSQSGTQSAYAFLNDDGTLNSSLSKNIANYKPVYDDSGNLSYECFETSFSPKIGADYYNGSLETSVVLVRGINADWDSGINSICGTGYNVETAVSYNAGMASGLEFTFYN